MKRFMLLIVAIITMCCVAIAQDDRPRDPLKPLFRISEFALVGTTAMDFASGCSLDQHRFHETSPMGQNHKVQALVEFGTTAGILGLTHVGFRRGTRSTKIVAIVANLGVSALHGWAAGHNWRLK